MTFIFRVSKYSNNRYLSSPQRIVKMNDLQAKVNENKRVKLQIELTEKNGLQVDPDLHDDMTAIMKGCDVDQFALGFRLFGQVLPQ